MEYFSAAEYFFYQGYRHGLKGFEWGRMGYMNDLFWQAYQDGLVIGRIDAKLAPSGDHVPEAS